MKYLFTSGILAMSLLTFAGEFDQYQPKSLNPVEMTAVKDAKTLTLAENGTAKAVLVIPETKKDVRIPYVKYCGRGPVGYKAVYAGEFGAQEIQKYVEKASGVKLPVITEKAPIPDGMIPVFVGMSKKAAEYGFSQGGIKPEGFVVKNNGRAIGIIGAKPGTMASDDGVAATLFGAYDFLERFAGIRFYYEGEQGVSVQKKDVISVPPVRYEDHPWFDHRWACSWTWKDQPDNNATVSALRWRSGANGWGTLDVFQHTPGLLHLMFDKVKDEDCLQLEKNGKRSSTNPPMPCYGNPKTLDYLVKTWSDFYAKSNPVANKAIQQAHPKKNAIGFGCPDHVVGCCCEYCKKLPQLDESRHFFEQNSEFMGQFAQKISKAVKEKFPDKRFYYLAYYNYCAPPKEGTFADNTYVRLCFLFGTSSYLDPYIQKTYKEWVDGWYKASGHKLSGYLYSNPDPQDVPSIPFQAPHAFQKFFRDMKNVMTGFFLCGMYRRPEKLFQDYCLFRLMWNPDFDVDAAIKEMYERLFGPAAPEMGAIYDVLTKNFESRPMSDFADGYRGGPYRVSVISRKEVFTKLVNEKDIEMIRKNLELAEQKVQKTDKIYQERFAYFASNLKLMVKSYDFFKRGGATDGKQIIAQPKGQGNCKIDGQLTEKVWQTAQCDGFVRSAMVLGDEKPDVPTELRIVRYTELKPENNGLLIGMKMIEPKMKDLYHWTGDTREIWRGNSVELFFDAAAKDGKASGNFIQIVISSDGKLQVYPQTEEHKKIKLRYAVHQGDGFWSLEVLVPFDILYAGIPLKERKQIRTVKANFVRNRILKKEDGRPDYRFFSRWRTQFKSSNHDVAAFGTIVVTENPEQYGEFKKVHAVRTKDMPVLDGVFDEPAWKTAEVCTLQPFRTSAQKTEDDSSMEFRILRYDHPSDPLKSGLFIAASIKDPKLKYAVLNEKTWYRSNGFEILTEVVPVTPKICRLAFMTNGFSIGFGWKPLCAFKTTDTVCNMELFLSFRAMFAVHSDPERWHDIPGVRFNIVRRRIIREPGKPGINTEYRWNCNSIRSPHLVDGFGLLILDEPEKAAAK